MQPPAGSPKTDTLGRVRPEFPQVDGAKLRQLRLRRGRTQAQAARLATDVETGEPMARTQWSAIERGLRPGVRPPTAFRLAKGVAPKDATDREIEALIREFT